MVQLTGINSAAGQLSTMQNLTWKVQAGTSTDPTNPGAPFSPVSFSATSTPTNLNRGGGALVSDSNSSIAMSTTTLGATNVTYGGILPRSRTDP